MPVVFSDVIPNTSRTREWWYNSLDAAVTSEIYDAIAGRNAGRSVYDFERSLQGPALDMMLRGWRIDDHWRQHQIREHSVELDKIQEMLNRLAHAVWGKDLNPRSPPQLQEFLYGAMGLPPQHKIEKGERKISTAREALEKLDDYWLARPIVQLIFAARDAGKTLGVLRTGIDPDGRMRCTYNVCGTNEGRWASSRNVFGRGTNLQNITEKLRRMFVADPGYVLVYLDGEQAESRAVGFIHWRVFGDCTYIDACEAGDLHTTVAKLVWPNLGWTGDARADRDLAESPFYRWFSYRDMAKRGGHGTNYYGKPPQMSRHLKVPQPLIVSFQGAYFEAFPMRTWHRWVQHQLQTHQSITTFLGRERTFFGRPDDDATLRKAIAYEPASAVADIVNEGGYRVWSKFPEAQVLAQIHDAYVFQIPETHLHLVDQMRAAFQVPVTSRGRTLTIPAEAKVGWNFGSNEEDKPVEKRNFRDGNPDGLRKWKGKELRTRTEDPEAGLLHRKFY